MSPARLLRALRRAFLRVLPRRFHTPAMAAGARVLDLTPSERAQLAENLRGMLRPKVA